MLDKDKKSIVVHKNRIKVKTYDERIGINEGTNEAAMYATHHTVHNKTEPRQSQTHDTFNKTLKSNKSQHNTLTYIQAVQNKGDHDRKQNDPFNKNSQKTLLTYEKQTTHAAELYFVTALVPSDTACLANSPGSNKRTAVCTSRDVSVFEPPYCASLDASPARRSNKSCTNEFMMLIALDEMPVSGCTCLSTLNT